MEMQINESKVLQKYERQTGFEILRILAMILICAVHIMNFGGMLGESGGVSLLTQRLLYSFYYIS